jgi:hypothetical protein
MVLHTCVLYECGATFVRTSPDASDPTTEEEFLKLQYDGPHIITWEQYLSKIVTVKQKYGLQYLRGLRNNLLQETDWLMTVDNFQTLENQEEWISYRQQLRDLPDRITNYVWKSFPNELDTEQMNFPKKPEIKRKTPAS